MTPTKIGDRYEIREKLGDNGAVVYDALDTERSQEVSIRRFAGDASTESPVLRNSALREQATRLAALKHPNFVDVFDFGEDEKGFYLVTEKLPGVNLERALARDVLSTKNFAEFAGQVLDGVRALHAADVIGVEFHPRNFVLCRQPDGGYLVKILSLGLMDREERRQTWSPKADTHVFSIVDTRADFLSLGRLFYQVLTGIRPCGDEASAGLLGSGQLKDIHHCKAHRTDVPMAICGWVMSLLEAESFDPAATVDQVLGTIPELDPEIGASIRNPRRPVPAVVGPLLPDWQAENRVEDAATPVPVLPPAFTRADPADVLGVEHEDAGVILRPLETGFIIDAGEEEEEKPQPGAPVEPSASLNVLTKHAVSGRTLPLHIIVLLTLLALCLIALGVSVLLQQLSEVGQRFNAQGNSSRIAVSEETSRVSGMPRVHAPSSPLLTRGVPVKYLKAFSAGVPDVTIRSQTR